MKLIGEILGLDLNDVRREKYNANASGKKISEVIIDGVSIKGYSAFSFVRKLTYSESPIRALDGTIGNLDSYPVVITPQLQIDFSLLSIDSYRDIMNLIYLRREHLVQCYDVVRDTRVTEKMYFEPEELPKLYTITRQLQNSLDNVVELIGVQDYTVVMIGTNNSTNSININYYNKNNMLIGSTTTVENTEIMVGNGATVDNIDGYVFNNAWERVVYDTSHTATIKEQTYLDNYAYSMVLKYDEETASKTISFRAKYKDTIQYSLSLSYGLGTPLIDSNGKQVYTIPFVPNDTLGQALQRANIQLNTGEMLTALSGSSQLTTTIDGITYVTHTNGQWYFNSQAIGTPISNYTVLPVNGDMIAYQVYEPVERNITFIGNGAEIDDYPPLLNVPYGSRVALPTPYRQGYTFDGWYIRKVDRGHITVGEKFNGIMPPVNITLIAIWVEN